jgi:hypothetical protein
VALLARATSPFYVAPWDAFVSRFCYYDYAGRLNAKLPPNIPQLPGAIVPEQCFAAVTAYLRNFSTLYQQFSLADMHNPQATDLGLESSQQRQRGPIRGPTIAANLIDRLQKELNFVLIADYFDESLMLLKRRLHWTMADMVYFALKTPAQEPTAYAGPVATFAERVVSVTDAATRAAVEARFLAVDVVLYATFNATFWRQSPALLHRCAGAQRGTVRSFRADFAVNSPTCPPANNA